MLLEALGTEPDSGLGWSLDFCDLVQRGRVVGRMVAPLEGLCIRTSIHKLTHSTMAHDTCLYIYIYICIHMCIRIFVYSLTCTCIDMHLCSIFYIHANNHGLLKYPLSISPPSLNKVQIGLNYAVLGITLLGASWDLVSTCTWAYSSTYSPLTRRMVSRVISPVT